MVEVTLDNGIVATVRRGKLTCKPKNEANAFLCEAIQDLYDHADECKGGEIPDRDYCYAHVILKLFKGKITKWPEPEPFDPKAIY